MQTGGAASHVGTISSVLYYPSKYYATIPAKISSVDICARIYMRIMKI